MANPKSIYGAAETGSTVYCMVKRLADGYFLATAKTSFVSGAGYPALAEGATAKGTYSLVTSDCAWDNGQYLVAAYKQAGGSPAPASDIVVGLGLMQILSDTEVVQSGDSFARLGAPAGASVAADVAAVKSDSAAIKTVSDNVAGMYETDGAVKRFTANSLELAPTGGGGSGSAAADIWAYETRSLTDKSDFALSAACHNAVITDVESALTAQGYTSTRAGYLDSLNGIVGGGSGSVAVDHDYPTVSNLSYLKDSGTGIDNADIMAFLKSDYDAGRRTRDYVRAQTITDLNGEFKSPMYLDPATYTILYLKQGIYGPDIKEVIVS